MLCTDQVASYMYAKYELVTLHRRTSSICSLRDGGICWESLGRGPSQPGDVGEEPLQARCGGRDTTAVQMVCLESVQFLELQLLLL